VRQESYGRLIDLLARPIKLKGKAKVPMEHYQERVSVLHHDEVSQPGGLGALLDIVSF
jgi:hypothetical protein